MTETTRAAAPGGTPTNRPVICMFVRNAFRNDSRVTREALTLSEEGFDVVVFGAVARREDAEESSQGPIRVVRVAIPTVVSAVVRTLRRLLRPVARRRAGKRPAPGAPLVPATTDASAPAAPLQQRVRRGAFNLVMPIHRFAQGIAFARRAGAGAAALRPAAYHCHDLNALPAGLWARRLFPAPVVYDSHELWPHRSRPDPRPWKTWILERADRSLSRRADAVITVSEPIALRMERYGLSGVTVVRNVPPLSWRVPPPDPAIAEGLSRPRLGYVGGIQPNRGLEQIIDAMPLIRGASLFAVGPGRTDYVAALQRRADRRGVSRRVRFLEPVPLEAVVPTIASADVGLCLFQPTFLSQRLTLPNKLFEYVHAGVPVLASDFPGWRQIVEKYGIGEVCDPRDPDAIARAVTGLLARPDELQRMRAAASTAAQELSWENERAKLLDVYRSLRVLPSSTSERP